MGFSLYLLYGTVSIFFPTVANIILGVFAIIFIPVVYVLPYFDYLANLTALMCGVSTCDIDEMSYGERTLHLSFSIFKLITKIIGAVSAILTFLATVLFSFIFWLVSGSWFEDGIIGSLCKLRDSYEITRYAAKIYNVVTSIAEVAFTKIIEWEKKGYEFNVRHRLVEPEMIDLPPVKQRAEGEDATYVDNIYEAQKGDTKAQVVVGKYLICYGEIKEGLCWLKKAYLQKEPTAYTAFGNLYMEGAVVEKNEEKAVKFYELGIKGKDPAAMYFLATYYLGKEQSEMSINMIVKLFTVAANMGEEMASVQLGKLYFEGDRIEKDEAKAFYWLNKAVMDGREYVYAGYYLGRCYLEGIGVERDEIKGFQILKNTEEEGGSRIDQVREMLINCYEKGIGVKRNTRKAKEYHTAKNRGERLLGDLAELIQTEGRRDENEEKV